jgi:DNA/RNA-binding domain of Phe-tRNA-synthetase-like protein
VSMMKYEVSVDKRLLEVYPEIRLGCMRFTVDVTASSDDFWKYMKEDVLPDVLRKIGDKGWSEIPGVRGSRLAYKVFGRNPGRYRVSSEALLRRVKRGDELYHVNSVVDVNNLLSVKSGLSVGSYDLSQINGPIVLHKAVAGEGYQGIGKDMLDMENMLVLADNEGIFGSSMSDSRRAMVTDTTKDVLVVVYCFENSIDLAAILNDGKSAFEKYAGAQDVETWTV